MQEFGVRKARLLAMLCALLVGAATPAAASEPPASGESEQTASGQTDDVTVSATTLPTEYANASSDYMWVWNAGRRGYQLTAGLEPTGFTSVKMFDLDNRREIASVPITRAYYVNESDVTDMSTGEELMAVDQAGGRLFVAVQNDFTVAGPGAAYLGEAAAGATCGNAPFFRCFAGFAVLDAATLETIRRVPVRAVTASGPMVSPMLVEMAYTEPQHGVGPKLHVVLRENAHNLYFTSAPLANPRQATANLTYLLQFDADTGVQEWSVRLDACRGAVYGYTTAENQMTRTLQLQAAVMPNYALSDRAVYVACHFQSSSLTAGIVRVALDPSGVPYEAFSVEMPSGFPDRSVGPEALARPPDRPAIRQGQTTVEGPERVYAMLADPVSGRILFQVIAGTPLAQVWWVFDRHVGQFVGTIGIGGPVHFATTLGVIAPESGRLYVLAMPRIERSASFAGGVFVAEVRRSPVQQALVFPELADQLHLPGGRSSDSITSPTERFAASVQETDGVVRVWYPRRTPDVGAAKRWAVVTDRRPTASIPPPPAVVGRTLDLPEAPGVTASTLDGTAQGYGFRAVLITGVEAAGRVGPVDPIGGTVEQCNDNTTGTAVDGTVGSVAALLLGGTSADRSGMPCRVLQQRVGSPCTPSDREVIIAALGADAPNTLGDAGARGTARPIILDPGTLADLRSPATRCSGKEWDALWGSALFGRAPVSEPSIDVAASGLVAECVSGADAARSGIGDPVRDGFSAAVECGETETSGHAYTRLAALGGVTVAESLATYRIYRDPGRGVVSRVESVARGIDLLGHARIDSVRGVAESWANGRTQEPLAERDPGYSPNCDTERSAGTCFHRHLFGVRTATWSCGPCGDEQGLVGVLNAIFGPYGRAQLREPDARLRLGTDDGFLAAVQKPEHERFADLVLNGDLQQTILPTLEFVRNAPPNRVLSRQGARGRQIYQFAGVQVSSSYGIQCLLVYDEASNTCAAAKEEPGSLTVNLTDADGKALAGGAFEVRADVDTDGVVGLKDALLPDGACVTTDDGVGTCKFDALQPGSYLVSQVAAPPGYGKVADPFVVELASGEARTVTFQNTSNVSTIQVSAADEAGKPVSGAVFAVYPDPDSDGKVAGDAKPAASCTTDASGSCSMQVPAGSYVLVQSGAPGGLEPIEPVAFTFASGGQTAAVGVTNYPGGGGVPAVEPAASRVEYSEPPQPVVTETVADYQPTDASVVEEPRVSIPEAVGGTIVRVIQAPGDALRLLSRDPKQAVAWTASLMLLALALMAIRRRRVLIALTQI